MTITAVLHVHITIMKKIPLRMIWFDCMCFDKQMLQCIHVLIVSQVKTIS